MIWQSASVVSLGLLFFSYQNCGSGFSNRPQEDNGSLLSTENPPNPSIPGADPMPTPLPGPDPVVESQYNIYVSPSGNDSNEGTLQAPVRSLKKAVSLVKPGTAVHVLPGVYQETVITKISGTSTARIRYISETPGGAKIIGSGTESVWNHGASYSDIQGFDISGSPRIGILNNGSDNAIISNHVHDIQVSGGCTGSGGAGIVNANYSARDNTVIGNVVHDIGVPGACNGVQGIYHSHLGGKIYNNVVYRASAFGIHLWHAANQVTIMNNTVFANGTSSMGGGILLGNGDSPGGVVLEDALVANNIVYKNPRSGIWEYCYAGQNCIGQNVKVTNNLVYANGSGDVSLKVGSAINTISADPLFVNDTGENLHLTSTSPAIGKGILTSAPATDLDGRTRGTTIDLGAYEY